MSRLSMCMDGRDITPGLATLSIVPLIPCFFYVKIMSLKNQGGIINIGTYNDNSREYNIDARGKDLSSILKACETEEVTPVQEKPQNQEFFCRITKEAYEEGKAQYVENDLRSACVSAPKLIKAIRTHEALSYLDTKNIPSTELYRLLNDHFELPFDVRAFQLARSK